MFLPDLNPARKPSIGGLHDRSSMPQVAGQATRPQLKKQKPAFQGRLFVRSAMVYFCCAVNAE
jgi:hypothetical protein